MSDTSLLNRNSKFIRVSVAFLPFLLLILEGLIEGQSTLHQKVFKSYLLCWFDTLLFITYAVYLWTSKTEYKKQRKFLLYFALYFVFILIQYIVTYFSGEISYDREYYLGNYIALILFGMSFYLFADDFDDFDIGLILIVAFVLIIVIWTFSKLAAVGFQFSKIKRDDMKFSFGNVNYFAGYYIGLWPLALISGLALYDKFKQQFQKSAAVSITSVMIAVSALGIIPLLLTGTRAAQLGWYVAIFVVMIPLYIIMTFRRMPIAARIAIAIAVPIVFIALPIILLKYPTPLVKKYFGRLVATIANPSYQIHDRLNGWAGGFNLFVHHPVFGAGLGTLYPSSFKYINNMFYMYSSSNSFKHAHGEYVEVLGEGGIFGEVFFVCLFMFVITAMLLRVVSDKYNKQYRLVCLGVLTGIVAMLVHQIFSLSLRMTVTMIAYYSLLGMGIFLISVSGSQLVNSAGSGDGVSSDNSLLAKILLWGDGSLSKNGRIILLAVMFIGIGMGFWLMHWTHQCEVNMVKGMHSPDYEKMEFYFAKANRVMPGNPYAWTQKYIIENKIATQYARQFKNDKAYYDLMENTLYGAIQYDLDRINGIIPGYQDVWGKYANLYLAEYSYYMRKAQATGDFNCIVKANECMVKANDNIARSLTQNFLNLDSHALHIFLTNSIAQTTGNTADLTELLKNYAKAYIYVKFARANKILASKIIVEDKVGEDTGDQNIVSYDDDVRKYHFYVYDSQLRLTAGEFNQKFDNFDKFKSLLNSKIQSIYDFSTVEKKY